MQTRYIKVDAINPQIPAIHEAASIIKSKGLVAFPTETVYGLGANAYEAAAVQKIFEAKDRPASTPLLVHVSNIEQVQEITDLTDAAHCLIKKFWPGPLSLILPLKNRIPAVVTAGRNSVGIRMPSHPVALALIECTGPLAAPSANLSGRPSPVTADHVKADLDGRIECVLDAGPTGSGLESTVLDLGSRPYKILRSGGVTAEDIKDILGEKIISVGNDGQAPHYQIRTNIIIAEDQHHLEQLMHRWADQGSTGVVCYNSAPAPGLNHTFQQYDLDLSGQHGSLFTILRDAEARRLKNLIFSPLPLDQRGKTAAIIDRIYEAAGRKNIMPSTS